MGLNENLMTDHVSDLAIREPVCCRPDEDLRAAIQRMRDRNLGCAIVVDDQHKPVGIVTESMITQKLANNSSAIAGQVSQHMAENCPWVNLSDPVALVLDAMQTQNTRFLCVVDDSGKVVGLTGQKGLMEFVADHFPQQVLVQRVGAMPSTEREGA